MRVKFCCDGYDFLAVREKPDQKSKRVGLIEFGSEFEAGDPIDFNGVLWREVEGGYVMNDFTSEISREPDQVESHNALEDMKLNELRELAKNSGVILKKNMKKSEIIEALLND